MTLCLFVEKVVNSSIVLWTFIFSIDIILRS